MDELLFFSPTYSIAVLPMLSLGAPMGVVFFHNLDPRMAMSDFHALVARRLGAFAGGRSDAVKLFLYRVDLTLAAFPGRSTWRFLPTTPFSQLRQRANYPIPMDIENTLCDTFSHADDIMAPHDPPRVIHVVAEIIRDVPAYAFVSQRFSRARRLLGHVDPDAFAQLCEFLSSPPELLPPTTTKTTPGRHSPRSDDTPRAPFYLANVPAVAELTLPERKLLVRPVFVKLLDEILRALPDKKRAVYVTATSGAGKTAFLWFVLHALCRRGRTSSGQSLAPPMDIVLDVPGLFVLIDTTGHVFTGPRSECFRVELAKKQTLYLADLSHGDHRGLMREPFAFEGDASNRHLDPSIGHASRILVGLPRHRVEERAGYFHQATLVKQLPPWKDGELELCRRVCFPALGRGLLLARTAFWGRQPLWTLALDPSEGVGEHRLADKVSSMDWLERLADAIVTNGIADLMCDSRCHTEDDQRLLDEVTELLVLRGPLWHKHDKPKFWRFGWSSPTVRDTVIQRVMDLQNSDTASALPSRLQREGHFRYVYPIWLDMRRLQGWEVEYSD